MPNVKIYDAGELFPLTDVVLLSDHNKALFDREKLISKQAKRIAELEQALAMASDPALHPTCADCDKCSYFRMETTEPKWISVEDVLPQWGKLVKIKFKDGKEDDYRFLYACCVLQWVANKIVYKENG